MNRDQWLSLLDSFLENSLNLWLNKVHWAEVQVLEEQIWLQEFLNAMWKGLYYLISYSMVNRRAIVGTKVKISDLARALLRGQGV
jgi:hypothetical protein